MNKNKKLYESIMKDVSKVVKRHLNEYYLLNEGRNADKARAKSRQIIRDFFNNEDWLDKQVAAPHITVPMTNLEYIENEFFNIYFHANNTDATIRLEPIFIRIALQFGFQSGDYRYADKLSKFKNIVDYIVKNSRNPEFREKYMTPIKDGITFEQLNDIFSKPIEKISKEDSLAAESISNNIDTINKDYQIKIIDNYYDARYYGDLSYPKSKLCYTTDESTWNYYTAGGKNRVYLLLKKDFAYYRPIHGENTPFDNYGLSMIFVFIDPKGNIAYSNTRWNHATEGKGPSDVDHSFTKTDLAKLLNVNFSLVFNSKEQELERIKNSLKNNVPLNKIFQETKRINKYLTLVKLYDRISFVNKNNELIYDGQAWFDGIESGTENKKYNVVYIKDWKNHWNSFCYLIDYAGRLIGDGKWWFREITTVKENQVWRVIKKHLGYLDKNGNLYKDEDLTTKISYEEL